MKETMKIFGTDMKKDDLRKRVGDMSQLGGIKLYELQDGMGKGIRAADINSPSGVNITVLIDRGMDISSLNYKSIPITWRSSTRDTSPIYYESKTDEWLRTFFGGLITTCGLENAGVACNDNGKELGLHGRISNISAENICTNCYWKDDEYLMEVSGTLRETKVFGNKYELRRKIMTSFSTPKIIVEDSVENIGFIRSPIMILYHVNIGYPVLDKTTKLLESKAKVIPRDKEAMKGYDEFNEFSEPIHQYNEQVFFHDIEPDSEGNANIALINEDFNNGEGIGIWLKYNKDSLPFLVEWKQMGEGEYVCGIEPGNNKAIGRVNEKKLGTLKFIKPGEIINYRLEFNILTSREDINNFKNIFCK
jgi:hypothetical protein